MKILPTPEKNYSLDIGSSFLLRSDSDIYAPIETNEEKKAFVDKIVADSVFKTNIEFGTDDRFVCLSTCSYDFKDARQLVIAKVTEL